MKKYTLTDKQWERIKDMLPPNGRRGNQWKDHRTVINGILWILKNRGHFLRDMVIGKLFSRDFVYGLNKD